MYSHLQEFPWNAGNPPTKAPFSGGKAKEESEEDTEEKGTFTYNYHWTKRRCLVITQHSGVCNVSGLNLVFSEIFEYRRFILGPFWIHIFLKVTRSNIFSGNKVS